MTCAVLLVYDKQPLVNHSILDLLARGNLKPAQIETQECHVPEINRSRNEYIGKPEPRLFLVEGPNIPNLIGEH